jgi:hypothetical protein
MSNDDNGDINLYGQGAYSYIPRLIPLAILLKQKSCFQSGPRQTSKTCLVNKSLGGVRFYNMLDAGIHLNLSCNLSRLGEEL